MSRGYRKQPRANPSPDRRIVANGNLMNSPAMFTREGSPYQHAQISARPDRAPLQSSSNDFYDNSINNGYNQMTPMGSESSLDDIYMHDMSPMGSQVPTRHSSQQDMMLKRKIVRRIELFRGNLVLNCPVPDKLIAHVPFQATEEVQTMRYTAATCNPDNFLRENYTLRQCLYQRHTELFICMTMYNEDDVLFARSMTSVMKNITYLCTRERSRMWSADGWKKIVVCIVADGRNKINSRVLEYLGIMGCYQEGIMKDNVNGKPVNAHIFEYTTQVCVDQDSRVRGHEKGMVPVQILFCLKEKNKKKLNSHRWFFNAFAPLLRPNVCILLDVGTKPTPVSFYHLWKAFDRDPNLGGACGEIVADIGRACHKITNPLVAAQNFEYKMSNILDKPLESAFGYISVLPGAFSAYRYRALLNTKPGVGPLASYFYGEALHDGTTDIFKANMYLAEDRILCFELVAKSGASWYLKYVKSAQAETDVPEGVAEFISQRRRWLNGSFFVATYALAHWYRIWGTGHNLFQKLWFQVQLLYNSINMLFTWFGISLFYLTFFFLSQNAIDQNDPFIINGDSYGQLVWQIFRQIYIFAIIVIVIASLGNRPQGSKAIYVFAMLLFALIMGMILFLVGWTLAIAVQDALDSLLKDNPNSSLSGIAAAIVSSSAFRNIFITLMSSYGLYLLISLLHADPWHMITCFAQYTFLLPSFINILMIYAFCNTHDISWGTKGDNSVPKLGGASKADSKSGLVELELPFENNGDKSNLNADYDIWLRHLSRRPQEPKSKPNPNAKLEDWYRKFRTQLVLFWLVSNAIVIVVLTNEDIINLIGGSNPDDNPFLALMFWSFLGLTLVRFIGSFIYLLDYWRESTCGCCC